MWPNSDQDTTAKPPSSCAKAAVTAGASTDLDFRPPAVPPSPTSGASDPTTLLPSSCLISCRTQNYSTAELLGHARTTPLAVRVPLPSFQNHQRLADVRLLFELPLRWFPPSQDQLFHTTLRGPHRNPPFPFNPPSSLGRSPPPFTRGTQHPSELDARATRQAPWLRCHPIRFPGLSSPRSNDRLDITSSFRYPLLSEAPALAAKSQLHTTGDGTVLLIHRPPMSAPHLAVHASPTDLPPRVYVSTLMRP